MSRSDKHALEKALEVQFPFEVTGFLIDVTVYAEHGIASGRTYRHRKADPVTGRFADGHQIITSTIFGFAEHGDHLVLITRNSQYVCIADDDEKLVLIGELKALPSPTRH